MIKIDRNMTYREIQKSLNIDVKAMNKILHGYVKLRYVTHIRTIASKTLDPTERLKFKKRIVSSGVKKWFLKKINRSKSNLVYDIATGNETWIYTYEPET